jgi:hypothetical protein
MGLGSYDGADDNDRRDEILCFLDFFDDEGPRKGQWNFGAWAIAYETLEAIDQGVVDRQAYALPAVGRLIMSHALRVKKGEWSDGDFWRRHRAKFADWLAETPKRASRHFIAMAGLESYAFKDGVYSRCQAEEQTTLLI